MHAGPVPLIHILQESSRVDQMSRLVEVGAAACPRPAG